MTYAASNRTPPAVHAEGEVCISILHPPGEDKYGYEKASERWLPIHTVETIMISVISMLSDPNDESPANLDAAVGAGFHFAIPGGGRLMLIFQWFYRLFLVVGLCLLYASIVLCCLGWDVLLAVWCSFCVPPGVWSVRQRVSVVHVWFACAMLVRRGLCVVRVGAATCAAALLIHARLYEHATFLREPNVRPRTC